MNRCVCCRAKYRPYAKLELEQKQSNTTTNTFKLVFTYFLRYRRFYTFKELLTRWLSRKKTADIYTSSLTAANVDGGF